MNIRFRTQDTRSSWARKLNTLVAQIDPPPSVFRFEEVPQTWGQWERALESVRLYVLGEGYPLVDLGPFRVGDTRQMWARKMNLISAAVEAGVPGSDPDEG